MDKLLNTLLDSFSVNQLRELALALVASGLEPPRATMNRDALLELIKTKSSDSHLALYAHRVEAVTPYKHLYLYSLPSAQGDYKKLSVAIANAFPEVWNGYRNAEAKTGELELEACLADDNQKRIYLKLAHLVEMSGWVLVDPKHKEFKLFRKRHPVVITLRSSDCVLTVSFPGFTYGPGLQHEDRLQYSAIADMCVKFVESKLNLECEQFPAKPAIDILLQEEPEEVIDIKRVVRPQRGGRFAFDAGEESKVTTALTDYFRKEGKINVEEKQFRELLRRSAASDIVLHWRTSDILTRVALLSHGAEILFVWRSAGASSSVVDSVLRKLVKYADFVSSPSVGDVRRKILSVSIGEILRPALVAQENGCSTSQVMKIVNNWVIKGIFVPQFRVNTDSLLQESENSWRNKIDDLPRVVTDEHGVEIDLTIPANIEVAFRRVK
ncbi:MAG TPA: hypothetical protein VG844_13840 [Terracidiphilus sp.]|nr:hypothetical protein [Terracidiphilus sp.]